MIAVPSPEPGRRKTATAYDALAERIRAQIISGELSTGDRLPSESSISEHYHVSRHTAREAIRLLASEGLVVTTRGITGGTFVVHPSASHLAEHLQTGLSLLTTSASVSVPMLVAVREMLEVPAAELAARHRSASDLRALERSLADHPPEDPAEMFGRNRDFHTLILQASHNPLLEVVTRPVFRVLQERFARELAAPRFWQRVSGDHQEIAARIRARDAVGAARASREHLRYLGRAYGRIDRRKHVLVTAVREQQPDAPPDGTGHEPTTARFEPAAMNRSA